MRNEDWEKWQLMVELGLVPEFVHRAIQRYKIPRESDEDILKDYEDDTPVYYHEGQSDTT